LARFDEGRAAWGIGVTGEIPVCREDGNEKREYREKVDLSGIVTVVADFPAHLILPSLGAHQTNAAVGLRFPSRQQCGNRLQAAQQNF
jgi:hypothetical protein